MPIWDHLDELRERVLVAALAGLVAVLACFCFSKDLVVFLEAPVVGQGVKFLQLSPGEFFFTTLQVLPSPQSFVCCGPVLHWFSSQCPSLSVMTSLTSSAAHGEQATAEQRGSPSPQLAA
jgi:hypothetical protein